MKKKVVGIIISLLLSTPLIVSATDDTTPPIISEVIVTPRVFTQGEWQNLSINCMIINEQQPPSPPANVMINITGPGISFNVTMTYDFGYPYYYWYYYLPDEPFNIGTYRFFIWASDNTGNTVTSSGYYFVVLDERMDYVQVDDSNTAGPWDGTLEYPFEFINDGLSAVNPHGTVFVHNGFYQEFLEINQQLTLLGESKENTIIDGSLSGFHPVIRLSGSDMFTMTNFTLQHGGQHGILLFCASNKYISNCITRNNPAGFFITGSVNNTITNCDICNNEVGIRFDIMENGNQYIYHNNFINNTNHVSLFCGRYPEDVTWDNGTTGNYWDDYHHQYPPWGPPYPVNSTTGTWMYPYIINFYSHDSDTHPWVYPNGYIDVTPPSVTVVTPNGGEVLSGTINIYWSAFDDLSHHNQILISLAYSPDDGNTWYTIDEQVSNWGIYEWDTSTVDNGNNYLICVNATDEFYNVGYDISDTVFTINNTNHPPETPDQPEGPTSGYMGVEYTYTTNEVIDPNGDEVFYLFDWGDGSDSGWISETYASHAWPDTGTRTYYVKVKAKDSNEAESEWSDPLTVRISEQPSEEPDLVIDSITGGIGVSAIIKNNGTVAATNINWTIKITGGIFNRINRTISGVIPTLVSHDEKTIQSGVFFGLGKIQITVLAICDEGQSTQKKADGQILFFWVKIL